VPGALSFVDTWWPEIRLDRDPGRSTRPMIDIMQTGDTVKDFTLEDQPGRMVTLSSLLESGPVVLYFYIKAKTSG
jgi:hypothetical protein